MRPLRRLALDLILDPTVHIALFWLALALYLMGDEPWRADR